MSVTVPDTPTPDVPCSIGMLFHGACAELRMPAGRYTHGQRAGASVSPGQEPFFAAAGQIIKICSPNNSNIWFLDVGINPFLPQPMQKTKPQLEPNNSAQCHKQRRVSWPALDPHGTRKGEACVNSMEVTH